MSGLDTIVKTILDEAAAEARSVLDQAHEDAERTLAEAKALTDGECEKIVEAGRLSAEGVRARADAAANMDGRRALLIKKQELLDQTVRAARDALITQPVVGYFGFLSRLAQKNAEKGAGVMYLSKKDLTRLPEDFHRALNAALPEGSTLDIASEARPIDGGFILKYGDIEQNCSLSAIFDENRERILDAASEALFQ
jgi:V/A-type H+-transporting ATPase subunit E